MTGPSRVCILWRAMRTHTKRRRHNLPGMQHLWGFDNGQLASVVPDDHASNRWKLMVLNGSGQPKPEVASKPPAAFLGALKPIDVRRILRQIEEQR